MKSAFFKIVIFLLVGAALASTGAAQDGGGNDAPAANQTAETADKYERLPFMQTEQAAGASAPGTGSLLVRTLGAMVIIVGLIFFGAWGLKKLGFGNFKAKTDQDAPELEIINSVSLGSGRTISTVKFGERILLVGSTAQSFTLLADETESDTTAAAAAPIQPRSVAEMLAEEDEEDVDSFADELAAAEFNLNFTKSEGERI